MNLVRASVKLVMLGSMLLACEPVSTQSSPPSPPGPVPTRIAPAPTPAPAPAPKPVTPNPRRNVASRSALEDWMQPLPQHGLFWDHWGLAGNLVIVIDLDKHELSTRAKRLDPEDTRFKPFNKALPTADGDALWQLAETAWHADAPAFDMVTDYREDIIALDGDQVMLVTVSGPMSAGEPAAKLALAVRKAANPKW